ncbi:hypothetical protein ASE11_19075 [Hydrogenophaga sp. Root209]|nr:hypothetical protein ASE11_19075 [Hydrogenophaga sp. Root209]
MTERRDVHIRTWQVGHCTVTLTVHRMVDGKLSSSCDWDPEIPDHMTSEMEAQWQAGLHTAIASIRAAIGQEVGK